MKKRSHVIYSGRVQGVGFRFVAQSIASELNITGWAKNLSDGRVEVVAEGEEKMLKDYLGRIQGYFGNYIRDIDIHWQETEGDMQDFGVKF